MNPALLWTQNAPTAPEAISSSHEQIAILQKNHKMIGCFYGAGGGLSNFFRGGSQGQGGGHCFSRYSKLS